MRHGIRVAVLSLALFPLAVLAGSQEREDLSEAERVERREKRVRMMRVLGLAEELGLQEAQALKMAETMRQFDERRRPLQQQVRESAEVLQRAAQGESAALGQVDSATQRVFEARTQLAALDRDMYQALSRDLAPQQRAQLALFLARSKGLGKMHGMKGRMGEVRERMRALRERQAQQGWQGDE
jgi:hypothetical protein